MKKLTVSMGVVEAGLGMMYIIVQLFILPAALVSINGMLPRPFSHANLNFINFAVNFICVTAIFHRYLIDSINIVLSRPIHVLSACLKGLVLYWVATILISMLVFHLDPHFSNVNDDQISLLTQQNDTLMLIGTVILAPVVEETLYRGVVFGQLYKKNRTIAYIVSVMVFACVHIIGYIGMCEPVRLLLCFLQYLPAGIVLAWTYVNADTIWAPVLIHMVVNLIGMLAIY